jgi:NADH-quinone oxidoreductase subunit H
LHRTPFDTTEAEAELTAGYQTEYGGVLFSLFYLSEYFGIILLSFLFSSLFLGGWYNLTISSTSSLILKTVLLVIFIFFLRAALPRIRIQTILSTA